MLLKFLKHYNTILKSVWLKSIFISASQSPSIQQSVVVMQGMLFKLYFQKTDIKHKVQHNRMSAVSATPELYIYFQCIYLCPVCQFNYVDFFLNSFLFYLKTEKEKGGKMKLIIIKKIILPSQNCNLLLNAWGLLLWKNVIEY